MRGESATLTERGPQPHPASVPTHPAALPASPGPVWRGAGDDAGGRGRSYPGPGRPPLLSEDHPRPPTGRLICARLSQPLVETGRAGTRSFTFLPLSSSNCSLHRDAIRLLHWRSCATAGPGHPLGGVSGAGEAARCQMRGKTWTATWSLRANAGRWAGGGGALSKAAGRGRGWGHGNVPSKHLQPAV